MSRSYIQPVNIVDSIAPFQGRVRCRAQLSRSSRRDGSVSIKFDIVNTVTNLLLVESAGVCRLLLIFSNGRSFQLSITSIKSSTEAPDGGALLFYAALAERCSVSSLICVFGTGGSAAYSLLCGLATRFSGARWGAGECPVSFVSTGSISSVSAWGVESSDG